MNLIDYMTPAVRYEETSKVMDEWITGATCTNSNQTGDYGHSDVELLYT